MTPIDALEISVNGEKMTVKAGTTVAELIHTLALQGPVAVEKNREVIPRAVQDQEALANGDTLELVTFVGGG